MRRAGARERSPPHIIVLLLRFKAKKSGMERLNATLSAAAWVRPRVELVKGLGLYLLPYWQLRRLSGIQLI